MTTETLSLDVPGPLYTRFAARARNSNRSVQAEMLEALAAAAPDGTDPDEIAASMTQLDESALWAAARSPLAADVSDRIEELHHKRQRDGLDGAETEALARLMRQYERSLLVRANAAAILKQRGCDVSSLLVS